MAIGIGLHCWYCEHGPCNGECNKDQLMATGLKTKSQKREEKINIIIDNKKLNMYKEPKEQAKEMFNKIRYMDGENKECTTCDCVVKPILKYMIEQIIESNPSGWFNNGFEWEKEFFTTPVSEGWVDANKYWKSVINVIDNL